MSKERMKHTKFGKEGQYFFLIFVIFVSVVVISPLRAGRILYVVSITFPKCSRPWR